MDVQKSAERYDEAISALPDRIKTVLLGVPLSVKGTVQEVRLRVGRPAALCCPGRNWFVDAKSQLHNIPKHCFPVTAEELSQALISMCSYSVHSHQHEFAKGYISLKGGHRAGICGTAVTEGSKVTTVRDITSMNIRVAREIQGAATPIINEVIRKHLCGLLIVGIPASGKTTILRDLARQLAGGQMGRYIKVAVVDERCELGAVYEGVPQNDLGASCDILSGYPKGAGILTAVRTLSPEVIICDEIGGQEEADSMLDGLNCGVKMIATAHAASLEELMGRPHIRRLIECGAFEKIVMLEAGTKPGVIGEILEVGELLSEADGYSGHHSMLYHDGNVHGVKFVKKGYGD